MNFAQLIIPIFFFSFIYSKKQTTPSAALHLYRYTNIKFNVYICEHELKGYHR